MKVKTPSFWYRDEDSAPPFIETAITPLSCLYDLGHKIHHLSKKPKYFEVPVICVGNVVAGGAGKTPTAIAISELLNHAELVKNPFFLTRGYGGHLKGPVLAHPQEHDFREIGDEALILSKSAPTVISEDRTLGAELAIEDGADVILMDDGLQNPGIHKDIKIIVINGDKGFGNKKLLPAGPLRSSLRKTISSADAFVIIGEDKRKTAKILPANKPVFLAKIVATKAPSKNKKYLAFAGIGYPDKFFNSLKEAGCKVVKTQGFPDHYPYHESDIESLLKQAEEEKAILITTEKDHQRLPKNFKDKVAILPIKLVWDKEEEIIDFFKNKLPVT